MRPGTLLLSKRSHRVPRLIYNEAKALTTDTIYRGELHSFYRGSECDIVSTFHNSLTLMTAEIEGRSFGGGVLELVPSEIARLVIPVIPGSQEFLGGLDAISRRASSDASSLEELVERTDELIIATMHGMTRRLIQSLQDARQELLGRRLLRN